MNLINRYMFFDLFLLTILATASEIAGVFLLKPFPQAGIYISFSVLITLIALIRWRLAGIIVGIISSTSMVFLNQDQLLKAILSYPVATLFIIFLLIFTNIFRNDNITKHIYQLYLYVLLGYLAVAVGKGIINVIYGDSFIAGLIYYLTNNSLSIVISLIIVFLLKNKKDIFVDMKDYFRSLEG